MEEWAEGFERTLAALSAAAQEVVVLRDSPYIYKHVPICLSRAHWRGDAPADCASPAATAYHDALWERELAIAARFANVRMVDLSSRFCSDGVCPPIVDGRIVYRDDNHMTASFARHLEPALAAALGGTSPGRAASAEVN